jgi:hypothetical protein
MVADARIQQLEQLQRELESRNSVRHFAHSGVSLILGLILAGAAGKLFWDSIRTPFLGWSVSLLAIGAAVYSVTHYRRGKRALEGELVRFERLKGLRHALGLDDPSALLPP